MSKINPIIKCSLDVHIFLVFSEVVLLFLKTKKKIDTGCGWVPRSITYSFGEIGPNNPFGSTGDHLVPDKSAEYKMQK